MCRFLAYCGPSIVTQCLIVQAHHSLIAQSTDAQWRKKPLNGDGCGLGWYPEHADPEPGTFVSIEPAWNSRNLKVLASKLKASLFFAHVRDATPGIPVSQANCHPFALGRYLFMHNGAIKPFHALRRPLLNQLSDQAFHAIQGNTDSELVFALLLERLHFQHDASLSNIIEALRETVALLLDTIQTHAPEGHASLNLGLSNGEWMLATRYTSMPDKSPISLFVSHGHLSCPSDGDFSLSDCHFPSEEATIIASEPLTDNERAWEEVPPNSIVIAHRHQRPRMEPLVL